MEIPVDKEVIEFSSSYVWKDEDGIFYSKPKSGDPPPVDAASIKAEVERLRVATGGKKVCFVLESNPHSQPPPKELRDLLATELNSITRAMAIITSSPLSKMIANLFFSFRPPEYPMKMFTGVDEAKKWIRQFCSHE